MPQVTVACKLPHGLIIQIPGAAPVRLNGANSSNVIGGHGLTEGVDKEFFDKWASIYKDFKPLKLGLIFAQEKAASAQAQAKEQAANKTGFEGLDPQNPTPGVVPENYEGMPKPKE